MLFITDGINIVQCCISDIVYVSDIIIICYYPAALDLHTALPMIRT